MLMKSKSKDRLKVIIGKNIDFYRNQRNLSQYALAKMMGVNQSNLSKIESGQKGISLWSFYNLSKELGVSMDVLLSENPERASIKNINAMLSDKPDNDIRFIEIIIRDILEELEKR